MRGIKLKSFNGIFNLKNVYLEYFAENNPYTVTYKFADYLADSDMGKNKPYQFWMLSVTHMKMF